MNKTKSNEKKLMLKKETVSNLKTFEMSAARGGAIRLPQKPGTNLCAPTFWEGCQ